MLKFFKRKDEPKEEVTTANEKELNEEELRIVNNFGSEEYKKSLEEKKDFDELTEQELDRMSYDYYHGDENEFVRK